MSEAKIGENVETHRQENTDPEWPRKTTVCSLWTVEEHLGMHRYVE